MARLPPLPPARQSVATRFCRWVMKRLTGRESGPMAIWAHAPRGVPAITLLNAVLETGTWSLEPALRKLVHLRVARIVGCVF